MKLLARSILGGLVLVALVFAAACGSGDDDATPGATSPVQQSTPQAKSVTPGGTLTIAFRQDIVGGIDPFQASATGELWLTGTAYETLVDLAPDYSLKPGLAESWTVSDDKLTWSFKLRKGVKFSDGSDLTAQVVKFNFDRVFTSSVTKGSNFAKYFGKDDVKVVDDETVSFTLKAPFNLFPNMLGLYPSLIASQKAVESGVDLTKQTVGTGPFIFQSFTPGVEFVFTKNPNYWGKDDQGRQLPYLDKLVFKVITDTPQRLNALKTGEADVAMFLDVAQYSLVKGDSNLVPAIDPTSRLGAITFNSIREPWTNADVRRAFSLALDRDALLKVGEQGIGEAAFGIFPKASQYYDTAVESAAGAPYSHRNVEEAKQLLAKAGYPNGLDLPNDKIMAQAEFPDLVRAAEAALEQLKDAGIRLGGVQVCPTSECGSIRKTTNWSMTTFAFPQTGDPLIMIEALFGSTGTYNHGDGNMKNKWDLGPEVQQAFAATFATAPDARFKEAGKLQQAILKAQPGSVPLFFMPQFDATKKNVAGYDVRPYNLQRNWASVGFTN